MIIHASGIPNIHLYITWISHSMMHSTQMSQHTQQLKPCMGKVLPVY